MKVTQSCLTLWHPMDCSLPGSSVLGILQARTLEGVAIPFRGSSKPQDWTQVSPIAGGFFTLWATREAQMRSYGWALIWHNSCPYKKKEYWGTSTEEQPGEDTAQAQAICQPRRDAQKDPTPPAPGPQVSGLQDSEKIHFCCLMHSVMMLCYGSLRRFVYKAKEYHIKCFPEELSRVSCWKISSVQQSHKTRVVCKEVL